MSKHFKRSETPEPTSETVVASDAGANEETGEQRTEGESVGGFRQVDSSVETPAETVYDDAEYRVQNVGPGQIEGVAYSDEAQYFLANLPDDTYRVEFEQQIADAGISPEAAIVAILTWAIEQKQIGNINRSPFTMQAEEVVQQSPPPSRSNTGVNARIAEPRIKQCEAGAPGCQGTFTPEKNRAGQRYCKNPACWHQAAGYSPIQNQQPAPTGIPQQGQIKAMVFEAMQEFFAAQGMTMPQQQERRH